MKWDERKKDSMFVVICTRVQRDGLTVSVFQLLFSTDAWHNLRLEGVKESAIESSKFRLLIFFPLFRIFVVCHWKAFVFFPGLCSSYLRNVYLFSLTDVFNFHKKNYEKKWLEKKLEKNVTAKRREMLLSRHGFRFLSRYHDTFCFKFTVSINHSRKSW